VVYVTIYIFIFWDIFVTDVSDIWCKRGEVNLSSVGPAYHAYRSVEGTTRYFLARGVGGEWFNVVSWPLLGLFYQSQIIDAYAAFVAMRTGRGSLSTERQIVPALLFLRQSHTAPNPGRYGEMGTTSQLCCGTANHNMLVSLVKTVQAIS
jgi:hypothetical protein